MSNAAPIERPSQSDLNLALIPYIRASILPGDTPLSEEAMAQTAEFLIEAALKREAGAPALLFESTTSGKRRLSIGIVNEDRPFLVDSVAALINALGLSIDVLVHPLVPIERDEAGELIAVGQDGSASESLIYIETPRVDARQRRNLQVGLLAALNDGRAAVEDWPQLQAIMEEDAAALDAAPGEKPAEEARLLRWLNNGMLTQLGHVTRTREGALSGALGICRASTRDVLSQSSYALAFDWFEQADEVGAARTLLILKANRMSNVHRRAALDLFIVPKREGNRHDGPVSALSIHVGVWTSAALETRTEDVPILRGRLAEIVREYQLSAKSHTGKALVHAFTTVPYDLLVGFSPADTRALITSVTSLVDRPRPRLILVSSPLKRHIYAFVWLPRDQMSTAIRLEIQALLLQIESAQVLDWSLQVQAGGLAMLQFLLDTRETQATPEAAPIERQLEELLRGWGEAVEEALSEGDESGRAVAIAMRYADAFPQNYRSYFGAAEAARDITRLRALAAQAGRSAERAISQPRCHLRHHAQAEILKLRHG
ncbi:MAG: glutamate dehydrogenase, partial [Pseudomonadota bacterium]